MSVFSGDPLPFFVVISVVTLLFYIILHCATLTNMIKYCIVLQCEIDQKILPLCF